MAKQITRVLDDTKLRTQLIKKGAAQAKKYSWDRMAKQTLDAYNKSLSK
jgi:glycosyltransferase involved in cell wall biosynthesis